MASALFSVILIHVCGTLYCYSFITHLLLGYTSVPHFKLSIFQQLQLVPNFLAWKLEQVLYRELMIEDENIIGT